MTGQEQVQTVVDSLQFILGGLQEQRKAFELQLATILAARESLDQQISVINGAVANLQALATLDPIVVESIFKTVMMMLNMAVKPAPAPYVDPALVP